MKQVEHKETRNQVLRVLGTLASLALLGYLLSNQGWSEIGASIARISLTRFLLVVGLTVLSRLAVTGRWTSLLLLSGFRIPLGQILRINFAGLFASNFLPTSVGGDIVRLAWIGQLDSNRAKFASSIAVDRLVGLAAMAMLLPLGVVEVLAGPGTAILGGLGTKAAWTVGSVASFSPKRWWTRAYEAIRRAIELAREWLANPKALVAALSFSWIHMILMFSSMRILFSGLGETLGFWQIAGLWSFVYFVSLFPISINSLGLMEVSTGLVYSSIGGAAISSALTVALLMRTASWMASLPGALSLTGVLSLRRSPATEADESLG